MTVFPQVRDSAPDWLVEWPRVYNATARQELLSTWALLAGEFRDDANLVAYEIPFNEAYPPDSQATNASYVSIMTSGFNLTYYWEQWLQARYGTIQALNATWNAHIYDQLNGTDRPPYRKTSFTSATGYSGEDHWRGIKPLGPYSYNFHWLPVANSARRTDWQLFRVDLFANLTRQVAQTIRKVDKNHVLATFRLNTVGFGGGVQGDFLEPRFLAEVPEIHAVAVHRYLNPLSAYAVRGQNGQSAYFGDLIASLGFYAPQLYSNVAIWHDEWGARDSSPPRR